MANDWQPGDLAMCINDAWFLRGDPVRGPRKGSVNTVTRVALWPCGECPEEHVWLGLQDWDGLWIEDQFTKIRPLSDEEKRKALEEIEQDKRVPEIS